MTSPQGGPFSDVEVAAAASGGLESGERTSDFGSHGEGCDAVGYVLALRTRGAAAPAAGKESAAAAAGKVQPARVGV